MRPTFLPAVLLLALLPALAPAATPAAAGAWGPLEVLGRTIPPGAKRRFPYQEVPTFEGTFLNTTIFVARGARPGPTLCLTALVHGDERNGFEVARTAFARTDPQALSGTLIALPAINVNGFRTGSRYMPDRRDLNRAFPGSAKGSNTELVAAIVFDTVRTHCNALVDLHTGSFERANLPQVRVDLANPRALDLARHFGAAVVMGGAGPNGSLRREAMDAGIPAIIYEAGLPLRFQPEEIAGGVQGVRNVMVRLGMVAGPATAPTPPDHIYASSRWLRVPVNQGGVFYADKPLGAVIRPGDVIAHVEDPFTDERHEIRADSAGTIVGMAVPQVVFSGYALIHVARTTASP